MSPKVLVLGLPRTGTQSIATALEILGFPSVYHMREVGKNQHQDQWITLLHDKFGDHSRPLNRNDVEPMLCEYDAVTDFPTGIFALELMHAYPNAHIILSVRDCEQWFRSVESTIWHNYNNPDVENVSSMRPFLETWVKYCWKNDFPRYGKQYFSQYYDEVGRAIPSGKKILEFSPADGWQPLCQFLGKPVPEAAFPRADDWQAYKDIHPILQK